jgi:outer membrane protein assembly factor BamB
VENGKTEWTFLPEGKVDSPPSYYNGRLVFGARDGSVYCLDALSGELAWRFRAAPADKQMAAFGQVESVWPVFGTLLIHGDKVYCTAGRHTNLNLGIYLYQLDINTGCPLISAHNIPDISEQGEVDTTVNADILVGDGTTMSLRGMLFDMESLEMIDKGAGFFRILGSGKDPLPSDLIVALGGFLDDSFFNGAFWRYNDITANMLSLDENNLYGVNIYSSDRFKSSVHANFYPGEQGTKLFAVSVASPASGEISLGSTNKKGRRQGALWTSTIPIRADSLLVGADNLYLAGVRDEVDKKDRWSHFDGQKGGLILVCSKHDGKLKSQIELKSPPVFDGLASADKKLFVSCRDGSVLCLE